MEPFAEISRSCGHNVLEWNGNNDKEENYYITSASRLLAGQMGCVVVRKSFQVPGGSSRRAVVVVMREIMGGNINQGS